MEPAHSANSLVEICILAGGLSSRMGRDKSKLRIDGRTLLAHIQGIAKTTGFPVRVIRRDLVPRCGPLGGIYTALETTSAKSVLFLACDMPQITELLLKELIEKFRTSGRTVFTSSDEGAGFPFLIRSAALSRIERLMEQKQFSLQNLAKVLRAKKFHDAGFKDQLRNLNTPQDWLELKKFLREN
ncbi:MAG: molybdenum cofactor guanylyltransferase [Verrucomicrobiota bacterium]